MKGIKIGLIGVPNAGKSSLVNKIVGEKVTMVANKPQSTRSPILGIYTDEEHQLVLVDTPGISTSKKKMSSELNKIAPRIKEEIDLSLFIFDSTKKLPYHIIDLSQEFANPVAVLNKVDLINKGKLLPMVKELSSYFKEIFFTSCKEDFKDNGIDILFNFLLKEAGQMEEGYFYDHNIKTTRKEDELINDMCMEVIYNKMEEEVPYLTTVVTISKEDFKDGSLLIKQNILVKPSHKHMFLSRIKEISISVRKSLSNLLKKKVHLILKIKEKD